MIPKKQPTYQDLTKLMFTNGNPKTDKNLKIESLKKYWIKRLNLAPASISGFNTCASASKGCREACLYDYTKHFKRMIKYLKGSMPSNYHLTFSRNEANDFQTTQVLKAGGNVAVVFRKELPATYKGFKVIDGDLHDLRFLDDKNVVVGLKEKLTLNSKGKLDRDNSGFVVDLK